MSLAAHRPAVKNQSLSRTTKPPNVVSQTWFSVDSRASPAGVCADQRGLLSESRSEAERSLPPDFVIVLTTPPLKRPYSAEIAPVSTVVS